MRSRGQEGTGGSAPWLVVRHSAHEGLGLLGTVLREAGIQHRTVDFTNGDTAQPELRGAGGLIILGGAASVCELARYPYLADECRLVEQALTGGRPVLGICLGAQLLAHVLGARVYHGARREVGWGTVQLTADARQDPLFADAPGDDLAVFHLHGDSYDLPADARQLARSDLYEQQAFEWGAQVYGFQFHLEFTDTMVARLMADPETRTYVQEAGADPDQLAAVATEHAQRMAEPAREIFRRFFETCGGVACGPEV